GWESVVSDARSARALDSTAKTRASGDKGPLSSPESKLLFPTSNDRCARTREHALTRGGSVPVRQESKSLYSRARRQPHRARPSRESSFETRVPSFPKVLPLNGTPNDVPPMWVIATV